MKIHRRIMLVTALLSAVSCVVIVFIWPDREAGEFDSFERFDLPRIIEFGERANAAYHEPETFRREYGAEVQYSEFPASGFRIYLDADPQADAQWVILRGTANLPNVKTDLKFVSRDDHELGVNVHSGFDLTLQDCLPWITERLDPRRAINITGHSLGGSVAALLAAILDHRGFDEITTITFGQPKFTDAHGADVLSHLFLLRVVHDDDPIPLLPPVIIGDGKLGSYHHSGPEVIVEADGHLHFLPEHAAGRRDVASLWADLTKLRPQVHLMDKGYLPALKLALKRSDAAGHP